MIGGQQYTLADSFALAGAGLHEGQPAEVRILPADPDTGFVFKRVDLEGAPSVALTLENLGNAQRRTQLEAGEAVVHTTEHIVAGLYGAGIDNAQIEISGEEPPALDGSCREVVEQVLAMGRREQAAARHIVKPRYTTRVGNDDAWIEIAPGTGGFEIVYHLDYRDDAVDVSTVVYAWSPANFLEEIAPARTFCLESEAAALQAAGFGKGANTSNTLVIQPDGAVRDNQTRFSDEFARHKILDLVGDFALLGARLDAKVTSWRGGHALNHAAVRQLLDE